MISFSYQANDVDNEYISITTFFQFNSDYVQSRKFYENNYGSDSLDFAIPQIDLKYHNKSAL